jgi:hypothetical protein
MKGDATAGQPASVPIEVEETPPRWMDRESENLLAPGRYLHDAGSSVFVLLGFWCLTVALDGAGWGGGVRTALLLALAALAAWTSTRARLPTGRVVMGVLGVLLVTLLGLRGADLLRALAGQAQPTVDIGATTIEAVRLWREGIDVYTARLDHAAARFEPGGAGFRSFGGFKYGPAMVWAYAPGVLLAGASGYFVTSALALTATVALAAACAWRTRSIEAALAAAALTLVPTALSRELFVGGVNDVVPVALALGAFLAASARRPFVTGLLLGLSLGCKLLPGLLLLLPVALTLSNGRRWLAAGLGLALVGCYATALREAPRELIANLLVYQVVRRPDSTSLVYFLPRVMRGSVTLLCWAGLALLALAPRPARPAIGPEATRFCAILVLFFWGAGAVHGNYLLWLFPFLAIALASNLWRARPRGET